MMKVKTIRKNGAGVFTAFICIALISLTSMADGHTTTSSTCKTCKGKGVVYEECPVCHGTRYVWKCKSKRYNGYYHSESQSERTGKDFDFCGYGSVYKPLHDCKNQRFRVGCPKCAYGQVRKTPTGRIEKPCPDCQSGIVGTEYYIVKDCNSITDSDRLYVFKYLDNPDAGSIPDSWELRQSRSRILKKRMNQEQLDEYKVIYANCKIFKTMSELKEFIKEKRDSRGTLYYIVRDADNVTENDRRTVFENLYDGCRSYNTSNLIIRNFPELDLEYFKKANPKCRVFETLNDLKAFMLSVKIVERRPSQKDPTPSFYIIRNAENVTEDDRRTVFENLYEGCSVYSTSNILVRRFSELDLEYFKKANPKCRVFETLNDLKAFMLTVKIASPQNDSDVGATSGTDNVPSSPVRRAGMTEDEARRQIEVDEEHTNEMIRRRRSLPSAR